MSLQFLQLDVELSTGSKLVPRTLGSPMVPGPMAGPGLGSILARMASQRNVWKVRLGTKVAFYKQYHTVLSSGRGSPLSTVPWARCTKWSAASTMLNGGWPQKNAKGIINLSWCRNWSWSANFQAGTNSWVTHDPCIFEPILQIPSFRLAVISADWQGEHCFNSMCVCNFKLGSRKPFKLEKRSFCLQGQRHCWKLLGPHFRASKARSSLGTQYLTCTAWSCQASYSRKVWKSLIIPNSVPECMSMSATLKSTPSP